MKNSKKYKDALVAIALPVAAANAFAGDTVPLGAEGLRAVLKTDKATAQTIADGKAAPGLKAGEATVILLGISLVNEYTLTTAANQYAKVYRKIADGTYTTDNAASTFVGYTLATLAAPGKVNVAVSA